MKYKPTTLPEARVHIILEEMELKKRVTYVLLGVFVVAFIFLIVAFSIFSNIWIGVITAAFDGLLAPTTYLMCKHYFGSSANAKKIENSTS